VVEEKILRNPSVSRVLATDFVFAQLWVGRDDDSTAFFNKLDMGGALPQYAIVDTEGNMLLKYDRPANVASMTPEDFVAYLEKGKALFKP